MSARIKRNRHLTLIGENKVDLMGRSVGYSLKQSQRTRGIRLEIRSETGLTVVVPRKYTQQQVLDILRQKSRWILRHLPSNEPVQLPLFTPEPGQGDKLYFMGRPIEIDIGAAKFPTSSVVLRGNKLLINTGTRDGAIPAILEKWYREQAATIFAQKADSFQQAMGLHYRAIFIRGQRTRWGSCSPAGNLTLNWKLLTAPEEIIDYVVVHELSHLRHMNHSRRFWDMVEHYCPNWRRYRKWLVTHEDELKARALFKL